jgi:flagellar assembly protein FliH
MPKASLKDLRRWDPDVFSARGPGAERRAANQPGAPADPAKPRKSGDQAHAKTAAGAEELQRVRTEALREGFLEGQAQARVNLERLGAMLGNLKEAMGRFEEQAAEQLLQLGIAIARQVVRTELRTHPDLLLAVVREVLDTSPQGQAPRELAVHPDDLDMVRTALGASAHPESWQCIGDPTIERGGCRLGSRMCDIDATLPARWAQTMLCLGRDAAWIDPTGDAAAAAAAPGDRGRTHGPGARERT